MDIVYTPHTPRNMHQRSIFLAGPTSRDLTKTPSWRPDALTLLREHHFSGIVFVPEPDTGEQWPSPAQQVHWEHRWLEFASCIMFWIPRVMETMPALTTNIEYGMYMKSGKIVVGVPQQAEHVDYIRETTAMYDIPLVGSLSYTVELAIRKA
jgi:hypothetical protein